MWQQQAGETAKAYSAFLDYCRMGPGRSLAKLCASYRQKDGETTAEIPPTKLLRTLERWSSKYNWQQRIEAWETELQRQEQELWETRRQQVKEADWQAGEELRALAVRILDQTAQFLKTTSRTARSSRWNWMPRRWSGRSKQPASYSARRLGCRTWSSKTRSSVHKCSRRTTWPPLAHVQWNLRRNF
jgi:hypothetical protein